MKLSLNWVKEFVTIPKDITPQKLGELLTLHTVEIEKIETIGDEVVYEIDNKSITHRPDLWGVYGMAREVAVITGGKLKQLFYGSLSLEVKPKLRITVSVEHDQDCPRYMAIAFENIRVASSPSWLKRKLELSGIRPINVIVDATNYIMLETGQPLHAFDLDRLASSGEKVNIFVRRAKKGEELTTLDGIKRILNEDVLIIADKKKALAIAGIMGGADSEIRETSSRILVESANFDAIRIRKAANILGLRTEASARFEKNLDITASETALDGFISLIKKLVPDVRIISGVADEKKGIDEMQEERVIDVSLEKIKKTIGGDIDENRVIRILTSLGFTSAIKDKTITVSVPSWRRARDITIPEDIIEEVARIYGYIDIIPAFPGVSMEPPKPNEKRAQERQAKMFLRDIGFFEVYNYSFTNENELALFGLSSNEYVALKNPISVEATLLRQSLIPRIAENTALNIRHSDTVQLFETGNVYYPTSGVENIMPSSSSTLPLQYTLLAAAWAEKGNKIPFYSIKQAIEMLLHSLHISFEYGKREEEGKAFTHPGRFLSLMSGKQEIGYISELHPSIIRQKGIGATVGICELNMTEVASLQKEGALYTALPRYPSVTLDVSLLLDKKREWRTIEDMVKMSEPRLIEAVEVFDIYEGKGLPSDKKSIAFHIMYRSREKTLTEEEVKKVHQNIEEKLKKDFGAEIR